MLGVFGQTRNKSNTGIFLGRQLVQDVVIEDKNRQDGMTGGDGMIKGGIVIQPQIAAKPKDVDCWGFVHVT